jgi:hypothetical protein
MSVDVDVREAIWNGCIAVQVSIDPSEFSHLLTSSDLYTVKLSSFYVTTARACLIVPISA